MKTQLRELENSLEQSGPARVLVPVGLVEIESYLCRKYLAVDFSVQCHLVQCSQDYCTCTCGLVFCCFFFSKKLNTESVVYRNDSAGLVWISFYWFLILWPLYYLKWGILHSDFWLSGKTKCFPDQINLSLRAQTEKLFPSVRKDYLMG